MNEQFELYENARKRIKQKKRLYLHFVIFLIGSVFLIILNKFVKVWEQYDWFVWAILTWFFLFILHFINVFITNKFMNKEWERKQTEKLVLKQEVKIAKLEKKIAEEGKRKAESESYASEVIEKEQQKLPNIKKNE
ncbi:2TM domain-containing protein [Lutibacter sp. A64]|uniref:2TM domain-containing protein n=1 Tax=Lutibacter sp. A64 TaxID=2918526 RepID=UPI001F06B5DF|nr:2TM domain-containing protein [Lutibacter sp. A64]UMB52494.1 2TM domain-containing protein [Lutibacter sp. A64]